MIILECVSIIPPALSKRHLKRIADTMTRTLRIKKPTTITLAFVTENTIQQLNKQFRKINKPTDVLSFNAPALPKGMRPAEHALGDIVIATTYAHREAKRRSIPLAEELTRLVVHGILHLYGYDHHTPSDEARMFAIQERCVERIQNV